jgi:hypothetical protein
MPSSSRTCVATARSWSAEIWRATADDVITHAAALGRRPVRIASGHDDPFYPGVQALARALPAGAVVSFGPGCHDASFFVAQEPPSLAFLASHLA